MMSDHLIQTLVTDLRPVRRLPGPTIRALRWTIGAAFCVLAAAAGFGFRADLALQLQRERYVDTYVFLAVTCLFAARSAFELSIPPRTRDLRAQLVAVSALSAWLLLTTLAATSSEGLVALPAFWLSGLSCVRRTALLALAPSLAIFGMVRRSAPLEYRWPSLFAALSAASLATLGTQSICANDEPWHALLWHAVPLLFATIAARMLGRVFYASAGQASSCRRDCRS